MHSLHRFIAAKNSPPKSHLLLSGGLLVLASLALIMDALDACQACSQVGSFRVAIAALGTVAYATLLFLGWRGHRRLFYAGVFTAGAIHTVLMAWLLHVSAWCLPCILTMLVCGILMVMSLRSGELSFFRAGAIYAMTLAAASALFFFALGVDHQRSTDLAAHLRKIAAPKTADDKIDAPLPITIYEREGCHFCTQLREVHLKRLQSEFGSAIAVSFIPASTAPNIRNTPTIVIDQGTVMEGVRDYSELHDAVAAGIARLQSGVSHSGMAMMSSLASVSHTSASSSGSVQTLSATVAAVGPAFYIRKGGTSSTCADWANACDSLPAVLQRGATYYIADGTYGAYTFNDPNSGTQTITITKATVADHGISTGWSDAYGDGEAVFTSAGTPLQCGPSTGFITIDGKRGTPGFPGSYGFRVTSTASRNGANSLLQIDTSGLYASSGNCDNWTVKYVDFDWNNGTSTGNSGAGRCIQWNSGLTNDNTTFDHIWCHHSSGFGIYANAAGSNYVITNSRFSDNGGEATFHHETLWNTDINGFTFVGNEIIDTKPGALTGWLMMGNVSNGLVANNLFSCTNSATCSTGGNGIIASWTAYSNSNVTIANNTFANLPTSGNPAIFFENTSNFTCSNNLVYTGSFSWVGCTSNTNNACGGGANCAGTNPQTGLTTAIFANWANKDLHLTAHTAAGSSLSSMFATDKDGVMRSFWDRGAYEFTGGTQPPVAGSTFYIRDGGTSTTCTDWTNACDSLPAVLQRGATYYIADGTYGSYAFDDPISGTQMITIRKATQAEHGAETGWLSTYGDGEAFFSGASPVWKFGTGYYDIDGIVGAGKASTPYGMHLRPTTTRCVNEFSSATMFNAGSNITNLRIAHLDADWLPATTNCTSAVPALLYTSSASSADITIDYVYFHDAPGYAMYIGAYADVSTQGLAQDRWKIMHSYFVNLGGGGGVNHHFEAFWNMNVNDTDFAYNWLENIIDNPSSHAQTGWLMIAKANGYRVHGNVFTCGGSSSCFVGGNGVIATWSSDNYKNDDVKIIDNTFAGVTLPSTCAFSDCGINFTHNSVADTNIVVKNNLYYNPEFTWRGVNTQSSEACGGGQACAGISQQTGITTAKFVNYAGANFRLASATAAGENLGVLFNMDMDGKIRGADGNWDRGAYEYVGAAADTIPPTIPTGLVASAVSAAQINLAWSASTDNVGVAGYRIFRGGAQIAVSASTSYSNTGLSASTSYSYTVAAYDAAGNVSAQSSAVSATTGAAVIAPIITAQPASQTVMAGQTATFTVTASGNAPLSYQWRKNGSSISGATSASYTTPITTTADSGALFSVVVSNSAGSATSSNASLTVNPVAQLSLSASPSSVIAGATITANWTGATNTTPTDWVSLYRVGDPDANFGEWHYTNALASGSLGFTAPTTPGQYEFRYFYNDGYVRLATSNTVTVNPGTGLLQGGFETPNVGVAGNYSSFQYTPLGSAWTFAGGAGISANGSGFTGGNPNAPEGVQVAFLQGSGAFSQMVTLSAGSYKLNFRAAQRLNWQASSQTVRVSVDGQRVGDFRPASGNYSSITTAAFTVTAGSHTVRLVGLNPNGGDNTAFVDQVVLMPVVPLTKG